MLKYQKSPSLIGLVDNFLKKNSEITYMAKVPRMISYLVKPSYKRKLEELDFSSILT